MRDDRRCPRALFARRRLSGAQPWPAREYVVAGRFGRFMCDKGWGGFTLPLPFLPCLIFYWVNVSPSCRVHEFKHVEQRQRMGFWRFTLGYLWALRGGYRNHPMEVEAYAVCELPLPHWAGAFEIPRADPTRLG